MFNASSYDNKTFNPNKIMQTYSNPMLNDGLKTKEIKGEKSKERERERGREGKDGDFSFRFRRIAFFSLSVANKDLVGWK